MPQGSTTTISTVIRLSLPASIDTTEDGVIDLSAVIVDVMNDVRASHLSQYRPAINRPYRCYSIGVENGRIKVGGVLSKKDERTGEPVHMAKTYKELGLPHRQMVDINTGQEYSWQRGSFCIVDAAGNHREIRLDDNFRNYELKLWQKHKQYPNGSSIRRVVRDSRTVFADTTPADIRQAVDELETSLISTKETDRFSWVSTLPIYAMVPNQSCLTFAETWIDETVLKIVSGHVSLTIQRAGFDGVLQPRVAPGVDPAKAREEDITGYRLVDAADPTRLLETRMRMPGFVFKQFRGEVKAGDVLQIVEDSGLYLDANDFKTQNPKTYEHIRGRLMGEYVTPYGDDFLVDIAVLAKLPDVGRLVVSVFQPYTVVLKPQVFPGRYSPDMLRSTPLSTTSGHLDVDLVTLPEQWTARRTRPQTPGYHGTRQQTTVRRVAPPLFSDLGTVSEIPEKNRPAPLTEHLNISSEGLPSGNEAVAGMLREAAQTGLSTSPDDDFMAAMEEAVESVITDANIPENRETPNPLQGWDAVDPNLTTAGLTPGTPID